MITWANKEPTNDKISPKVKRRVKHADIELAMKIFFNKI